MASLSRRRMRLRTTALPVFLVTVRPKRGGPPSPRSRVSNRKSRPRRFSPERTARNSARLRSLRGGRFVTGTTPGSGRQLLAAVCTTGGDDAAAALGGHAGAEAVAALANKLRGLVGALHLFDTAVCGPSWFCLGTGAIAEASRGATRIAPGLRPERGRLNSQERRGSQFRAQGCRRIREPTPISRIPSTPRGTGFSDRRRGYASRARRTSAPPAPVSRSGPRDGPLCPHRTRSR